MVLIKLSQEIYKRDDIFKLSQETYGGTLNSDLFINTIEHDWVQLKIIFEVKNQRNNNNS